MNERRFAILQRFRQQCSGHVAKIVGKRATLNATRTCYQHERTTSVSVQHAAAFSQEARQAAELNPAARHVVSLVGSSQKLSDTGECPLNVIKRHNTIRLIFSLTMWAEPSHIARPHVPGWNE
jgi:hypothetical protein